MESQPPSSAASAYPNVNPYPAQPGSQQASSPPPTAGSSSMPPAGPGAGFPMRSGLAGMQPHSMATASSYVPGSSGGGMRGGGSLEEKNVFDAIKQETSVYARKYQALLDRSTPHVVERWVATAVLFLLFSLSVIFRQGWYIIMYGLAIYILNLFLAFLQPRFDPGLADDLAADDVEEGAPGLPGSERPRGPSGLRGLLNGFSNQAEDEEFRPFIRRLPEFKFWYSATKATTISLLCTLTRATDVPVYWPILLVYFITLFALTMRRQIQHMIKYRYVPFDLGKKARYGRSK